MTGVRCTAPAAPNPSTGTPSEASVGTAKPGGNEVPIVPPARAANGAARMTSNTAATTPVRFIFGLLTGDSDLDMAISHTAGDVLSRTPRPEGWTSGVVWFIVG